MGPRSDESRVRMQNRREMQHCKLVLFSIPYTVFSIWWEWRDFKNQPKLPTSRNITKVAMENSFKHYKKWTKKEFPVFINFSLGRVTTGFNYNLRLNDMAIYMFEHAVVQLYVWCLTVQNKQAFLTFAH